jgi:NAD(P)-dependent dehydrogenase (short-subunit alcohol dehydrogenase family)
MAQKQELKSYAGSVAIVTGGASGLGRALAEQLSDRGAAEVVIADQNQELAEEVANAINAKGGHATPVHVDVRDYDSVATLIKQTRQRAERLDYIFNNAGVLINGFTNQLSIYDWNHVIDINLRGVINGMHAAYLEMRDQGFGHIVNTSSLVGLIPGPTVYSTAKHGVVGASVSLRSEAADFNVRVSALCPGAIKTPMLEEGGRNQEVREEFVKRQKLSEPEALASDALDKVAKNKPIIVTPKSLKIGWWLYRIAPEFVVQLARKERSALRERVKERGVDV